MSGTELGPGGMTVEKMTKCLLSLERSSHSVLETQNKSIDKNFRRAGCSEEKDQDEATASTVQGRESRLYGG